uniref:NADH-ubiquinone oxidoreductase chain 4L n=1 Tax=Sigalphus bicolor TaxID=515846 RepID=A0A0A6ZM15_9HYME|nr:NADH dehydrogenase subunit 4L [Sigalphus bicolor]
MYMIIILLFLMSFMLFCLFYKHILMTLISLEFIMVNLMMLMYLNFLHIKLNLFIFSYFLSIAVCESVMGLSLLIYMIRYNGNDYMKILNLIKW